MSLTEKLRSFWGCRSFEEARDTRVTIPARPEIYNDGAQRTDLMVRLRNGGINWFSEIVPGKRILDFGCGVGRVSRVLTRYGLTVYGVDVSPEMLSFAKQYVADEERFFPILSTGSCCGNVPRDSCDGAVSFYCFQHCPTAGALQECIFSIHHALKPGAWFVAQSAYDPAANQLDAGEVGFAGFKQRFGAFCNHLEYMGFDVTSAHYPPLQGNGIRQYQVTAIARK